MKKSDFFCIFFAIKFGQFKKKQYLCIRFRSKMGQPRKVFLKRGPQTILIFGGSEEQNVVQSSDMVASRTSFSSSAIFEKMSIHNKIVVQETNTNLEKSELVSSQTILHLINRLFWAIL